MDGGSRVPGGYSRGTENVVWGPRCSFGQFQGSSLTAKIFIGLGIHGAICAFSEIEVGQLLAFPSGAWQPGIVKSKREGPAVGGVPPHHVVRVGGGSRSIPEPSTR